MQHVGDDGSREGEHDGGGISGEQVTSGSRLRACERDDVRQSGASQTETIDGLEWVERFKDAKGANSYPQSDNQGMLMTLATLGTNSLLRINSTKQGYATTQVARHSGSPLHQRGMRSCTHIGMSPQARVVQTNGGGSMRRTRFTDSRSLRAQAGRARADEAACVFMVACSELQRNMFSPDGRLEPCRGRSRKGSCSAARE
jgi:hypothetical protein